MSIRDSIGKLVGKTIKAVIVAEAAAPSGRYQVHFALADGTCFEFFGGTGLHLQVSSRLRQASVDEIVATCRGAGDEVRVYR